MKNIIVMGLAIFLFQKIGKAQTVIMKQDVNKDTIISEKGPNKKWHSGLTFGLHSIVGDSEGDTSTSLISGRSLGFTTTVYQKYRINQVISVLGQLSYRRDAFFYTPPPNSNYTKHINNDVLTELSLRFNYGKRGNYIGYYVEIGGSANYTFLDKFKTKSVIDKDNQLYYEKAKTVFTGMNYVEPFNYSAHARLGFNKIVLTADYRLSDNTNDNVLYNLPPLYIGLRFDFGA